MIDHPLGPAMRLILLATLSLGATPPGAPHPADPPVVHANDNRQPAGRLQDGVLHLELEVRLARWFPEEEDGASLLVPVFAERGKSPQIPGPLIRVPTGTILDITVTSHLTDSAVNLHGLLTRPADRLDTLTLAPGESRRLRFSAGAPATYLYWGDTDQDSRARERQQLAGAFVVDEPNPAPDRVFVINIWSDSSDPSGPRNALAINGRGWPFTELITAEMGDTIRWRIVNASIRNHPMHLHGFYFQVERAGHPLADTLYPAQRQRTVVTEMMTPRRTMMMSWSPDRPGNWLFHCHTSFHVVPSTRLDNSPAHGYPHEHMAGLVLGIKVNAAPGWQEPTRLSPRKLQLELSELPRHRDSIRTVGLALGEPGQSVVARSPGPMIVLTRGEPTDLTVINRLSEATAIHWHGIELESWSDGVAGWSGDGPRVAPAIEPGDSFVARLTLPRAGTFIYHTHMHDLSQLTGGLYGAIVVLESGRAIDPERDHVFTVGWDGLSPGMARMVANGDTTEAPLETAVGTLHRFRFVNIGPSNIVRYSLTLDSIAATWQIVARDGADLPVHQVQARPAGIVLGVGMTSDAEWRPEAAGEYMLSIQLLGGKSPFYRRRIVVR